MKIEVKYRLLGKETDSSGYYISDTHDANGIPCAVVVTMYGFDLVPYHTLTPIVGYGLS